MEYAHIALALALMPVVFATVNLRKMPRLRGAPPAGTLVSILIPPATRPPTSPAASEPPWPPPAARSRWW
jgi:hypothetical protein